MRSFSARYKYKKNSNLFAFAFSFFFYDICIKKDTAGAQISQVLPKRKESVPQRNHRVHIEKPMVV